MNVFLSVRWLASCSHSRRAANVPLFFGPPRSLNLRATAASAVRSSEPDDVEASSKVFQRDLSEDVAGGSLRIDRGHDMTSSGEVNGQGLRFRIRAPGNGPGLEATIG